MNLKSKKLKKENVPKNLKILKMIKDGENLKEKILNKKPLKQKFKF
jgi:hypothetical protein